MMGFGKKLVSLGLSKIQYSESVSMSASSAPIVSGSVIVFYDWICVGGGSDNLRRLMSVGVRIFLC